MINNYELYNPTRLIFGENRIEELNQYLPEKARILFVYGQGSIKRNGIYNKVLDLLKGREFVEFSGIEPNPVYETLMKAVILGRENNIDFILAVGGGSVIDGAKFISAAIPFVNDEPWNLVSEHLEVTNSIPLGTILTLPATGSEMNRGAVISNKATGDKLALISEKLFPVFSILDISVLKSLPKRQIANGIVDAFVHVTEQYITYPIEAKLQDRFAESILLTLIEEGPKLYDNVEDTEAGANVMFCATMALNGMISSGVPTDWSVHMVGHELTALYDIDHARSLAIILPALYSLKINEKLHKLVQFAERVWKITKGSDMEKAQTAIEYTEKFFRSLGIPTHLGDYDVDLDFTIKSIKAKFESRGIDRFGENGIISINNIADILHRANTKI